MNPFGRGSSANEAQGDDDSEENLQAIDALVDSDPEETDIFDDSDNDEDQNTSSIHSRQSSQQPSESPASFKDVVRNLGQPLLNTVPKMVMRDGDDDSGGEKALASDGESSSNARDQTASSNKDDDSGSAEDYSDDEDEGEDGYKPGGYHRVSLSETYNQRYVKLLHFLPHFDFVLLLLVSHNFGGGSDMWCWKN